MSAGNAPLSPRPDEQIDQVPPLSDEAAMALFALARQALGEALLGAESPRPDVTGIARPVTVNITVYRDDELRGSMSGRGPTLEEAVLDASQRTAADRRFGGPLVPDDIPHLRIELWRLLGREWLAGPHELASIDLGLHGVELRLGAQGAYYKPSVALTGRLTSHERLLNKLAKKAGLFPEAWRIPGAQIIRTTWEHYVDAPDLGQRPLRLRRLRPLAPPAISRVTIEEALRLAQDRLAAVQDPTGEYLYRYLPFGDRVMDGPTSLVRQAGCAQAMSWSAAHVRDRERQQVLRRSASAAVRWLLGCWRPGPDGAFALQEPGAVPNSRPGKLGVIALTLVALQHGPLPEIDPGSRDALRSAVLARQHADGSFRCFADTVEVSADGRSQYYFPGEALLALAEEARQGDGDAAAAAARALPWYRDFFRRTPHTAFVMWHAAAWRRLLEAENQAGAGDPADYADFVLEIVDWLASRQFTSTAPHPDYLGAFARSRGMPDFSTATFTEATVHGYAVAHQLGDDARVEAYRDVARRGLQFVLRLQISPETATLFPNPVRAVGGTTRSLEDFMIRSDFDQHTITAMLAALQAPGLLE